MPDERMSISIEVRSGHGVVRSDTGHRCTVEEARGAWESMKEKFPKGVVLMEPVFGAGVITKGIIDYDTDLVRLRKQHADLQFSRDSLRCAYDALKQAVASLDIDGKPADVEESCILFGVWGNLDRVLEAEKKPVDENNGGS